MQILKHYYQVLPISDTMVPGEVNPLLTEYMWDNMKSYLYSLLFLDTGSWNRSL